MESRTTPSQRKCECTLATLLKDSPFPQKNPHLHYHMGQWANESPEIFFWFICSKRQGQRRSQEFDLGGYKLHDI